MSLSTLLVYNHCLVTDALEVEDSCFCPLCSQEEEDKNKLLFLNLLNELNNLTVTNHNQNNVGRYMLFKRLNYLL